MRVCGYCGTWMPRYARHTCAGVERERQERRHNTIIAWVVWVVIPWFIIISLWIMIHRPMVPGLE